MITFLFFGLLGVGLFCAGVVVGVLATEHYLGWNDDASVREFNRWRLSYVRGRAVAQ